MKYNLLVWTAHSCRPDVFFQELDAGNLPNYSTVVERGLVFPNAVVGGHFQRTSNLSEITGRPFNSAVHPRENLLNAAAESGATVGVVQDFIITTGAQWLVNAGRIESVDEVYPALIDGPSVRNIGTPSIEFLPDLTPDRWLYWYRDLATHRNFYNFALSFRHEGGLLEDVAAENPEFIRDQQRYSLRLQDKWFGTTLNHLAQAGTLDETVLLVFSSHGVSIDGWLPLMGELTRANVDHAGMNFHPNVSRSFAMIAGPSVSPGRVDDWISIMDLKPTLTRLLGIDDQGGSAYGVDLMADLPTKRILADVTDESSYSLFDPASEWLLISGVRDEQADVPYLQGLPSSPSGLLAFHLGEDPGCATPRTRDFLASASCPAFEAEIARLGLRGTDRLTI